MVKLKTTQTRLTSAEIGDLWTAYMLDSLNVIVTKYFLQHVEDYDFRKLLDYSLNVSQRQLKWLTDSFNNEELPVPVAFGDQDVNMQAPRLFSDTFYPVYQENVARAGMIAYSTSLPLIARSDVREFISHSIETSAEISDRVVDVLINKGLYVRPPYISVPRMVDFVTKKGFLGDWFGKQRPIVTTTLIHITGNIRANVLTHTLCLGFAQVAKQKAVRDYMLKGKELATKHIETLSAILRDEDIPASTNWDAGVTDSVVAPLSEKLMTYHVAMITAQLLISNYGVAISLTMRRDITAAYTRMLAEMMAFAEDGINIMIKNGWFEQPPQNIDHVGLAAK